MACPPPSVICANQKSRPHGKVNRMRIGRRNWIILAAHSSILVFTLLVVPLPASASDTMERISRDGEINIGYRTSSAPLSFIEKGDPTPIGYNIDVCMAIVESIKKELKVEDVKVNFVPDNGATRVPMLLENKIDLECGSTIHTLEREKFIAFSIKPIGAVS